MCYIDAEKSTKNVGTVENGYQIIHSNSRIFPIYSYNRDDFYLLFHEQRLSGGCELAFCRIVPGKSLGQAIHFVDDFIQIFCSDCYSICLVTSLKET